MSSQIDERNLKVTKQQNSNEKNNKEDQKDLNDVINEKIKGM
jgi:hypothetical protein